MIILVAPAVTRAYLNFFTLTFEHWTEISSHNPPVSVVLFPAIPSLFPWANKNQDVTQYIGEQSSLDPV